MKEKVKEIEATVISVADSAQVAMGQVALHQQKSPSECSDWSILDSEEFLELKARVEASGA